MPVYSQEMTRPVLVRVVLRCKCSTCQRICGHKKEYATRNYIRRSIFIDPRLRTVIFTYRGFNISIPQSQRRRQILRPHGKSSTRPQTIDEYRRHIDDYYYLYNNATINESSAFPYHYA